MTKLPVPLNTNKEEEELKVKIHDCGCYLAKTMATDETFLVILRNKSRKQTKWIDLAGALIKPLALYFLSDTADQEPESDAEEIIDCESEREKYDHLTFSHDELDKTIRFGAGHFLGLLLFHLFGASRDSLPPCSTCLSNPSIKDLTLLLESRLKTTPHDLHYQRPLDSNEDDNLAFIREALLEQILTDLTDTLTPYFDPSSTHTPTAWIEHVGDEFMASMAECSLSGNERHGHRDYSENDEPFDWIWDFRLPREVFLREVAGHRDVPEEWAARILDMLERVGTEGGGEEVKGRKRKRDGSDVGDDGEEEEDERAGKRGRRWEDWYKGELVVV